MCRCLHFYKHVCRFDLFLWGRLWSTDPEFDVVDGNLAWPSVVGAVDVAPSLFRPIPACFSGSGGICFSLIYMENAEGSFFATLLFSPRPVYAEFAAFVCVLLLRRLLLPRLGVGFVRPA